MWFRVGGWGRGVGGFRVSGFGRWGVVTSAYKLPAFVSHRGISRGWTKGFQVWVSSFRVCKLEFGGSSFGFAGLGLGV